MLVPLEWLKQYVAFEAAPDELAAKLTMCGLEVEAVVDTAAGPALDVYVTPNRGDCLSILGVAREVAAIYSIPLHTPAPAPSEEDGQAAEITTVQVEAPDLCSRYALRIVERVRPGPSPTWMQARLEAAGIRPISNIVDVTNYVMMELGQPLHAFDLDRLEERRVVVRRARSGEKIRTLDGIDRRLTDSMLVIADAARAAAVAGIMGGEASEITDATTRIALESAHFDPVSVRATARALGVRTEASYRFERCVDPEGVRRAVDRACELLEMIGLPPAVSGAVDVISSRHQTHAISLRIPRIERLLGVPIPSHRAADCLRALGCRVETHEAGGVDILKVEPPSWRADLKIEEDLIEEVGRLDGYDNIPERLPDGATLRGGDSSLGKTVSAIREALTAAGLQEACSHSLRPAPPFPPDGFATVTVRNALSSDISTLRPSLLFGLLDAVCLNAAHGTSSAALFEVGNVWRADPSDGIVEEMMVAAVCAGSASPRYWQKQAAEPFDFYRMRGILEALATRLGLAALSVRPAEPSEPGTGILHPGRAASVLLGGERIGCIGELHPAWAAQLSLRTRVYVFELPVALLQSPGRDAPVFQPLARFPAISRDIAPRLPQSIRYSDVEAVVRHAGAPLLESVTLTDLYRGEPLPADQVSMTLACTFRSADRTLTDTEVNQVIALVREAVAVRCGAEFPG